ncbi:hypothetical protein DEO72_LG11g176 [Vigna unguiculata]|uniref:Uncharacterized protein n=1 Tax=Vigna unguiculata TaxID=3917 RepID=A0A4D6NH58_VIGUN|nr:hypothetical protein DEO72_LG11g176 [Vigna unguiculata]
MLKSLNKWQLHHSTTTLEPKSSPFFAYDPIKEEFETKVSQVKSEQGSCSEASEEHNNNDVAHDEIIRTQCWVEVASGKNKRRMCEAGQLAANHIGGRGSLKHRPSSSICRSEQITYLMQQLEASDQAYENL